MNENKINIAIIIIVAGFLIGGIFMAFGMGFDSCNYNRISASQLSTMLNEDYQYVDIRTLSEYNAGHIEEFDINLDFYQFENNLSMLDVLDKNKPVVIICNSGNRSGQAYTLMQDYGFKTVYDVIGGMQAWYSM